MAEVRVRGRGRTPVSQCTEAEWREICRRARAGIPAPEGWAWRFVRSGALRKQGLQGECSRAASKTGGLGTILIRISTGMSVTETEDTLIHEMAHGFDRWDHHGWSNDHGDTFFIWYGRLWRRYHGVDT